ncbi:O-antigen ligase family protein [Algoriphagus terrigena]|uniref:O-antigen ligase family protein n=1 Tax=Algoriphagus terrigena TaxID=344884 RepID=UPI00041E3E34|nr:O-antigen ligase family protein [Algoriphagus terrigena]
MSSHSLTGPPTRSDFSRKSVTLTESLLLLSLVSIFLPWKVYPVFFLISSFFFVRESWSIHLNKWMIALAVYVGYGLVVVGLTYSGSSQEIGNAAKLLVNPLFLVCSIHWLSKRENTRLTHFLDWTLGILLLLSLLQLLVYHASFDFRLILGSDTSGQASGLYRPGLYYWGLDDKNMFGARIALLGFVFVFIPVLQKHKLSAVRILFVFLIAFLSLSRTPMVALLIGIFALSWMILERKWRIVLLVAVAIALPFFLTQVVRIDSITSSNDGMGIRIVYWTAFFTHFSELSIWGGGFLEARDFLQENAKFYRGEPHIHNTFMTTYVEFGIIGFLAFTAFIGLFFQACLQRIGQIGMLIVLFLPILAIMMILYSGYDNDVAVYFVLIWLVGSQHAIDFHHTKIKTL